MMNPNQPRTVGQPQPMTAPQPAPVIPIGPDPAQRKLIQAMMAKQMQELSQARTPQEAVGRALPLYAATFRDYQDKQAAKERQEALTKALTGATDYDSLIGAMVSSGDPDYQKAALSQRLSQWAPKPPEKPLRGKDRFINTDAGIFDTTSQTIVPGTEKEGKDGKPIEIDGRLVGKREDGSYGVLWEPQQPAGGGTLSPTAEKERQKVIGKGIGEAEVALPGALNTAEEFVGIVDKLLVDPGLPRVTGLWGGNTPNVWGSARRAQSFIDQLGGKAFLESIKGMRGTGALSDAEGAKVERAFGRLQSQDMDDADYKQALIDLRDAVAKLYEVSQAEAGIPPEQRRQIPEFKVPDAPGTDKPPVQVTSPQERDALPPGTQYIAPDGTVRTKQ